MPINPIDKGKRRASVLERFRKNTVLTRTEEGSINRAFIDSMMNEIENLDEEWERGLESFNPLTAESPYAEMWGEVFGVVPSTASRAIAYKSQKIVRFKVESGTFGDYNGGQDINIPSSGFLAYGSNRAIREGDLLDEEITFELLEDVILPNGDSEAWVTLIASGLGAGYAIDSYNLSGHNFINYASYPDAILQIENVSPILGGLNEDSDSSIRSAIFRANFSKSVLVEDALIRELQSIPGADDIVTLRGYSSPGSVDFFIDSISYVIPDSLITEAKDRVESVNYLNEKIKIHKMKRVGVGIESKVLFKKGTSDDRKQEIINGFSDILYDIFSRGLAGVSLNFDEYYSRLITSAREISFIGSNKSTFDKVIIFRSDVNGKQYSKIYENQNPNIVLKNFEKAYPEINMPKTFNFLL